jgi:hypothetical protein
MEYLDISSTIVHKPLESRKRLMGIDNMIVYRYTKFALKESQYLMMASFVMTFQIMGLSICG